MTYSRESINLSIDCSQHINKFGVFRLKLSTKEKNDQTFRELMSESVRVLYSAKLSKKERKLMVPKTTSQLDFTNSKTAFAPSELRSKQ
jgi:hypothetical protein